MLNSLLPPPPPLPFLLGSNSVGIGTALLQLNASFLEECSLNISRIACLYTIQRFTNTIVIMYNLYKVTHHMVLYSTFNADNYLGHL